MDFEIADLPISSIVDGWVLHNGKLYLLVKCPDGVVRTVQLERNLFGD